MNDQELLSPLAAFPTATRQDWEALADPGSPAPLYTAEDDPAGVPLGRRSSRGWVRVARVEDAHQAREALGCGAQGVAVERLEVLGGAALGDAPLVLESHAQGPAVFDEHAQLGIGGVLFAGADPLGALAATGELPSEPEEALASLVEVARRGVEEHPAGRALRLDAGVYQRAGAEASQELAIAAASLVGVLRAGETQGADPTQLAAQLLLSFEIGRDLFDELAKLRAARVLWGKVLVACGVDQPPAPWIHAATSWRTLTRRDPMTNALRATTQVFAAAVGGADSVAVRPFDSALDSPSALGRRLATHTQSVLALESHLDRVADPAGGSHFIEHRTDELARAAWRELQEIERLGGLPTCLLDGSLRARIDASWDAWSERLARGEEHVLGVTLHPNPDEDPPPPEPPFADSAAARQIEPFPARRDAALFESEEAPA